MDAKSKQEFLELYKDAHEPLSRFCMAKSYGVMDPADLVSETVLAALEGFDKLKNKQAFLAYLFSIANNKVNGALRRKKFSGTYHEQQAHSQVDTNGSSDARFDISILYEALNELPEQQKEAVILFEISGFSIREIMEIQESGESAVKQRLKRGREKLASLFQADKRKALAGLALLWMSQNANSAPTTDAFFEIAKGMEIPISQEQIVSIINSYQGAAGALASVTAKATGISLSGVSALAIVALVCFSGEETPFERSADTPAQASSIVELVSEPELATTPESSPTTASYEEHAETLGAVEEIESQPVSTASFFSSPEMQTLPATTPLISLDKGVKSMPLMALDVDTTKKVVSQKAEVEAGTPIQVEVDDSDIRIELWDKDYVEVKSSVSFEAKDDESSEIADRNLQAELKQVGNNLTIKGPSYCHVFNNFHAKYGKATFENGEKAFIRKVKIDYIVYVPKDAPLDLDVAYGKLTLPNMPNGLKLTLSEGTLYGGDVNGNVELDLRYSDATLGTFKNGELDVHESNLTFKTADDIKLKTAFSNIEAEKVNTLDIDGNEGHIDIDEIANLNGKVKYYKCVFKTLGVVDLEIYECKWQAESVEVLDTKSNYSYFEINTVGQLKVRESNEDQYRIKHLTSLEGDSKYTYFGIRKLDESADIKTYECRVEIDLVAQSFKSLDFEGKYTKYDLEFEGQSSYDLVVNAEYTGLIYPEDDSEIVKLVDKDDSLELNCTVNKAAGNTSSVKFKCYEGYIELTN